MMKKEMFILLTLFLGCCNFAFAVEYKAADGDSLIQGDRRIRLNGIDAPEFIQVCYDINGKEYPCGLKSLQYLESLMKNSDISCDCLPEPDIYGREICECFADGVSLNRAMVFAGYAQTYRSDKYTDAEKSAKSEKRGIWQGKFMRPALFRALERVRQNAEK